MQCFLFCWLQDSVSYHQNICNYIRGCVNIWTVPSLIELLFCYFCLCPSVLVEPEVFFFFWDLKSFPPRTDAWDQEKNKSFRWWWACLFFFFPKRHNKLLTSNVKEPGFETVIRIRNLNAGTWPCLSNIPYKSCSCQKNEPVHFTIKAAALTVLWLGDWVCRAIVRGLTCSVARDPV